MTRLSPKFIGVGIISGLLVVLAGMLCVHIRLVSGFNSVMWLPCGVAFSTLFLLDLELWPFILVAELVLFFWMPYSPIAAILASCGNVTAYYFGARFLKNKLSSKTSLDRLKDLFTFLVIATFLVPLVLSSMEVVIHLLFGQLTLSNIFVTWRGWWIGQGMAILVVGAFAINIKNDRKHWWPLFLARKYEAVFLFSSISVICVFLFTPLSTLNHSLLIRPYVLFSMMLLASLRFDLMGAMLTSAIITVTAAVGGLLGFVAFSTSTIDPNDRMVMLQFMLGAITLTGLVVATTVREKSEALEARNEFLDIASHELKTPITSLKLQLQLLQRRMGKQTELTPADTEQVVFLGKVDRQVNRLVKIVEQLLDVSRVERKMIDLEVENVNLNELILQLADRLAGDVQNAKCTLKLEIAPNLKGMWDPFRIEQILENLISNAIKYASGKLIEVIAEPKGTRVEIRVRDNGPGIDPAKQHSIFDRFVRASVTRHVQGLGLGLFITRRLVETHGGLIFVDSETGKGTTFTVILPVNVPAATSV